MKQFFIDKLTKDKLFMSFQTEIFRKCHYCFAILSK